MSDFNEMQTVKRRFFAMRNGELAKQLRMQGAAYNIIFGLNLPQLVEIASSIGTSAHLAEMLWSNTSTRESLLLAPMIYPVGEMTFENALNWIDTCPTAEVADVLCHRLLRKLPFANDLVSALADSDNDMHRYLSLRLLLNLFQRRVVTDEAALRNAAKTELSHACRLTLSLARMALLESER